MSECLLIQTHTHHEGIWLVTHIASQQAAFPSLRPVSLPPPGGRETMNEEEGVVTRYALVGVSTAFERRRQDSTRRAFLTTERGREAIANRSLINLKPKAPFRQGFLFFFHPLYSFFDCTNY